MGEKGKKKKDYWKKISSANKEREKRRGSVCLKKWVKKRNATKDSLFHFVSVSHKNVRQRQRTK